MTYSIRSISNCIGEKFTAYYSFHRIIKYAYVLYIIKGHNYDPRTCYTEQLLLPSMCRNIAITHLYNIVCVYVYIITSTCASIIL